MKLIHNSNESRLTPILNVPRITRGSQSMLRTLLTQKADNLWGTEGKNYRVVQDDTNPAGFKAVQIVIIAGCATYGESLTFL